MLGISLNPISWVTDAAGAVVDAASTAILEGIVAAIEDGLSYVANAIGNEIAELGGVDFGSATVQQMSGTFKWIALIVAVGAIMASAGMAVVSSQGSIGDTLREIPITLVMMAGWFGAMSLWVEIVTALTGVWTTDALIEGLSSQVALDSAIALMVRGVVALLLMLFLLIFFVELLVLGHMLTIGVIVGQVAIALRPVRPLREVSGRMIRNVVSMSLVPPMGMMSLALSMGRVSDADGLSFGRALGGLAGMVVSVLMPMAMSKFLPLGGQSSSPGRSMIAAGAGVAGASALVAGGAGAAAAASSGGGLGAFVSGGAPTGGSGLGLPGPSGGSGPAGGSGAPGGAGAGAEGSGPPRVARGGAGGAASSGAGSPSVGGAAAPSSAGAGGGGSSGPGATAAPMQVAASVSRMFEQSAHGGDER